MLYKTHQRYGLLSGLLGIPLFVSIGLIPIITKSMRFSDTILVLLIILYSNIFSLFGSEYPDCDSYGGKMANGEMKKGSIPSQKHPLISKIFRLCGVKHRGKYSHDYASIGFFFGGLWVLQHFLLEIFQNRLVASNGGTYAFIFQIIALWLLWFLSKEISAKYKFHKKNKNKPNAQIIYITMTISILICLYLLTTTLGFTSFNFYNVQSAYKTAIFVRTIMSITILFTWIGAYSHLFADMMTNEGVYCFGFKIAPAKIVLKVEKFKILPSLIFGGIGFYLGQINGMILGIVIGIAVYLSIAKTDLKTGSAYEDACFMVVTVLCIPSLVLAIISISGGDVIGFLRTLGLVK